MASAKRQKPAGAALVMIDEAELARLLNLPDGVWVEETFVPHATYGRCLGMILWTDRDGVLPTIESGHLYEDISHRFRLEIEVVNGKQFQRAVGLPEWDLPEDRPDTEWERTQALALLTEFHHLMQGGRRLDEGTTIELDVDKMMSLWSRVNALLIEKESNDGR